MIIKRQKDVAIRTAGPSIYYQKCVCYYLQSCTSFWHCRNIYCYLQNYHIGMVINDNVNDILCHLSYGFLHEACLAVSTK